MKKHSNTDFKIKYNQFINDLKFIRRRLPAVARYLRYGPALRYDLSMHMTFVLTGEKGTNPRGNRTDTVQEKTLKQAISVFSWRTCQVLRGLGFSENDAICRIQDIVGEDRCDSFLTNGRKLTPRWSSFAKTAEANKADRTFRPITSKMFPADMDDEMIKTFHMDVLEALTLGLDQATKNGILLGTWINQFNKGAFLPDYSDTYAVNSTIMPKNPNHFLWVALFGGCNPVYLWNEGPWPDEFIYAYDAAVVVGELMRKGKATVSPQASYAVASAYYQEETDEINGLYYSFTFPPIRRLLDLYIDVKQFNAATRRRSFRGTSFTLYAPDYSPKPIMARLKEKVCEIEDMAPPKAHYSPRARSQAA